MVWLLHAVTIKFTIFIHLYSSVCVCLIMKKYIRENAGISLDRMPHTEDYVTPSHIFVDSDLIVDRIYEIIFSVQFIFVLSSIKFCVFIFRHVYILEQYF
jgi:hypothetical protein